MSVLNFMGRVPSWVSWVQCYCAILPLWVFRGSKIFSRGYLVGLKYFPVGILWVPNLFPWVFRGSKIFSGGYFVRSKFFLEGNYVILREKIYRIKSHETIGIEMYLKLCIIFQIDFNSYEFYLYSKGTSNTKLLMLLRRFSLYQLYFQSPLFRYLLKTLCQNSSILFLFVFLLKFIESHKTLDIRNTRKKKSWTHKIPTKKNSEPTKKTLEPTKYPREKI